MHHKQEKKAPTFWNLNYLSDNATTNINISEESNSDETDE